VPLASKQLIFVCHSMGGINGRETSETASVLRGSMSAQRENRLTPQSYSKSKNITCSVASPCRHR
jgi:hypothetical protein